MDNKLRDLVLAAIDKTNIGGLRWTGFGSGSFRTKIGSGHLHVLRGNDGWDDSVGPDQATAYTVQVTDARGRVVAENDVTRQQEDFKILDRLFHTARGVALGTDQVIEDMLLTLRGGTRP